MVAGKGSKVQRKILLGKFIVLFFVSILFGKLVDKVVASVNGEPILSSDLKMAEIYYGIHDKDKLLNRLIELNLFYQYLAQRGIDIPDEKVDELVRNIARSNGMTLEELVKELHGFGLTLKDFKELLKKDLIATVGLREYLLRSIKVSEIELELAKLKSGKLKVKKKIELVSIPKEKASEVEKLITSLNINLKELAERLDGQYKILSVEKGDLIEELDERVWRAKKGEMLFAEDSKKLYIIRILGEEKKVEGVDEEKLKREILTKKLEEAYKKLRDELIANSVITIID